MIVIAVIKDQLNRSFPHWLTVIRAIKDHIKNAVATQITSRRFAHDPSQRFEQVALTLGCNRRRAFWRVIMPQARGGLLAAGTLAWARALGEFGPILVFAGATRQKTEVLPTSAFLELQAGRTEGMLAVSLIMIAAAVVVFIIARTLGMKRIFA